MRLAPGEHSDLQRSAGYVRPGRPSAEGAATYRMGRLALELAAEDPRWLSCARQRFRSFATTGPPTFRIELVVEGDPPAGLASPMAVHQEETQVQELPGGFEVRGSTFHAEVDLSSGQARISGPMALYPLDRLLDRLWPALHRDGVIFHAASLRSGEEGWLAVGPSGIGKSTLARLFGDDALGDELAGVATGGDLFALPVSRAQPGEARLRGILLLDHGEGRHRMREVAPREAWQRISSQVLWPDLKEDCDRALQSLVTLVESFPVYELSFLPRRDVRDFLARVA